MRVFFFSNAFPHVPPRFNPYLGEGLVSLSLNAPWGQDLEDVFLCLRSWIIVTSFSLPPRHLSPLLFFFPHRCWLQERLLLLQTYRAPQSTTFFPPRLIMPPKIPVDRTLPSPFTTFSYVIAVSAFHSSHNRNLYLGPS